MTRTSVRAFAPDAVPTDRITRLLDAAVRAPNHKLTEPWRFVVVTGAARDRYAAIRRAYRVARLAGVPDADARAEKTWREHRETPAFIFVLQVLSDDPVRREEDSASVYMAMQNLMVMAVAEGLGTYLRTGGIMNDPGVRELAGADEQTRIVGIISLGFPAAAQRPGRRTDAGELTTWLD